MALLTVPLFTGFVAIYATWKLRRDKLKHKTDSIYEKGCGIDNVDLAWGHDEYLYQVLTNHKTNTLPDEAMVMIRYHSFYPWYSGGAYTELLNEKDEKYLEIIRDFNKFDLYTKSQKVYDLEEVLDYFQPIAEKYLGSD